LSLDLIELEKEKSRRKEHEITKSAISLDPVDQIVKLLAHIVALIFLHNMREIQQR
jgi:hypothetical protein